MKRQYTKPAEATLEEREIVRETVEELIRDPQQVIKWKRTQADYTRDHETHESSISAARGVY